MTRLTIALPETDIDVEASWQTLENEAGYQQTHAGLGMWKTLDDLQRYVAIIERDRPEVVVETGTRWGGFAAFLSDVCSVEVITVDVERTEGRPDKWPGVTYVLGDSAGVVAARAVRSAVAKRRCMVSLDADHHRPHVEREIMTYGPLVSPGCALVVEDGLADLLSPERAVRLGHKIPKVGGPLAAVATTIEGRPEWRRDLEIENMSTVSHSPGGWWRRAAS